MTGDRFVVLGLAHVRSTWAIAVTRWATTGSLPVEFVKCVGADELRARLGTGRVFSAGLLDARLPAVDRDLVATLADHGVPSIIVDDASTAGRDWLALGAVAVVRGDLAREALLDALQEHGRIVDAVPSAPDLGGHDPDPSSGGWRGHLVAVTGRSGAGASTIAAALAQRVADDPRQAGDVVLVDLCRRAHQALLHDARDVVPGVQELVESHRTGRPSFEQVRALCFEVPDRRYRLVLGLRRATDWVTVRPRAFGAALDGLRRSARLVVADVDADLDGEAETGSFDVEDRNVMARAAVAEADVVVAVATPTITGLHGLASLLDDLRRFGVPGDRTVIVLNRAPRNVRARSELTRVVAALTGAHDRPDAPVGPVYVTERRGLDAVHRDLGRFPATVADPPGAAVLAVLDRLGTRDTDDHDAHDPVPIRPGELAHWTDHDPDGNTGDTGEPGDDLPDAEVGR